MGVNNVDAQIEQVVVQLRQIGDRATKHVSEVLEKGAEDIRDSAREFAPIDDGYLRNSIKVTKQVGDNRRNEFIIDIDPDAVDDRGNSVLEYGTKMNYGLAPYGSGAFNLGRLSQQYANAGQKVGGLFMQRALKEHKSKIVANAVALAKRAGNL